MVAGPSMQIAPESSTNQTPPQAPHGERPHHPLLPANATPSQSKTDRPGRRAMPATNRDARGTTFGATALEAHDQALRSKNAWRRPGLVGRQDSEELPVQPYPATTTALLDQLDLGLGQL